MTSTKKARTYKYPYEVFGEIEKLNSFEEKVQYLKSHGTFAIKTILQGNFSPSIVFDLPHGPAPYNKDMMPPENSLARIDTSIKSLNKLILVKNTPAVGLVKVQKEKRFIQLLESINAFDAEIIIQMKDKALQETYPSLTLSLVETAFPQIPFRR